MDKPKDWIFVLSVVLLACSLAVSYASFLRHVELDEREANVPRCAR